MDMFSLSDQRFSFWDANIPNGQTFEIETDVSAGILLGFDCCNLSGNFLSWEMVILPRQWVLPTSRRKTLAALGRWSLPMKMVTISETEAMSD